MKKTKKVYAVLFFIFFLMAATPVLAKITTESDFSGTYYGGEIKSKNGIVMTSFRKLVPDGAGHFFYEYSPSQDTGKAFYRTWENGRLSIKYHEESQFGDAKGSVSPDGNYFIFAETIYTANNGTPDIMLGIRESSGMSNEAISGIYNVFIFYQTPGTADGNIVNTNSGLFNITAPGTAVGHFTQTLNPVSGEAQPITGDYAATYSIQPNGQMTIALIGGQSAGLFGEMQGMTSKDGEVFVAVETTTADNTQAFVIGFRQRTPLVLEDFAGNYYFDDFGYFPIDADGIRNDAASFISRFSAFPDGTFTFVEEDTTCDICPCEACPVDGGTITGNFVVSPGGKQYTATLNNYPEGRKLGGQINLSPNGTVFNMVGPLYLGLGIRQTSGQQDAGEPIAVAGPDQSVIAGTTITLDGSGSTDEDGAIIAYNWIPISGNLMSSIILSDATAQKPTFTSTMGGVIEYRLIVTDNEGKTGWDTVTITIAGNNPPVAEAGLEQTVYEGNIVVLDGSGSSDPDDGVSAYAWMQTAGPAVTISDAHAVQPTFTAPAVDADTAMLFDLTVTDNAGNTNTDTVKIIVIDAGDANKPPTANAGEDRKVASGSVVTLDGSGSSDPDDGIIAYAWAQTAGPAAILSDARAVQPTFTAPEVDADTAMLFVLTVTDKAGKTSTDTVEVIVINSGGEVNQPPTANAGQDLEVEPGSIVTLDGSGSSDPDDGIVSYAWSQILGPPVTLSDIYATNPAFPAPSVSEATILTFQLTVTDNGGQTGVDSVDISIQPNSDDIVPATDKNHSDGGGGCFITSLKH